MSLYANINAEDFWKKSQHLLSYGSVFTKKIIVSAKGVYLYTSDNGRILDFTSGQMSCLVGHGHPEVAKVISDHAYQLDHLYSGMVSPPVVDLAAKLCNSLPQGLDKAFFLSTGSEANEAAIKLAKNYTGKYEVVGLSASWHGMTGASSGTTYQSGRNGYGPVIPGNLVLPAPNTYRYTFKNSDGLYDWETELDYGWSLVDSASTGALAAVIIEPVLSSGGMLVLPDGYLKAMKRHCERRGALLIVDEAQTALGRCGAMYAFEDAGIVPDILSLSKTLGNGVPLSAVVTSNEIAKVTQDNGYLFYTTHINDPLPASVGLKVMEIVERDNLVVQAKERGELFLKGLKKLKEKFDCIGDIRGRGLMVGVEIVKSRETKEPDAELASVLASIMMERGLSANLIAVPKFGGVFRIAPPITITEQELEAGLAIMESAFATVSK